MDPVAAVRRHGVLLESARGPVPSLAELVAGERIAGSWWGHPKGHEIYDALSRVEESAAVARTRLLDGKVTLVHRRVWIPLTRLVRRFPDGSLDAVRSEHTASGAHRRVTTPVRAWVPPALWQAASVLSEADAWDQLPRAVRDALRPDDRRRR